MPVGAGPEFLISRGFQAWAESLFYTDILIKKRPPRSGASADRRYYLGINPNLAEESRHAGRPNQSLQRLSVDCSFSYCLVGCPERLLTLRRSTKSVLYNPTFAHHFNARVRVTSLALLDRYCWLDNHLHDIAGGANLAYGRILGEVNAQEPAERQIRLGDRRKTFYVVWRHAELFPTEDRKRSILRVLGLSGILALLTFCVAVITCFGSVVNR